MSKGQIIHAIISAIAWITFIVELNILNGFFLGSVLFLVVGVLISAFIVKVAPSEYYLIGVFIIFVIVIAIAIPIRTRNLKTQAKAIGLYEQGRYEESMDEFMKIKNTGWAEEYVEKCTVYKLKGTDIEVRVEE